AGQFAGSHPAIRGLWNKLGRSLPAGSPRNPAQAIGSASQVAPTSSTTSTCATTGPVVFNREGPTGLPELGYRVSQNEESVDFIPGVGTNGADLVIQGSNDDRGVFVSLADDISHPLQDPPNSWGFG